MDWRIEFIEKRLFLVNMDEYIYHTHLNYENKDNKSVLYNTTTFVIILLLYSIQYHIRSHHHKKNSSNKNYKKKEKKWRKEK